MCSLKFIGFMGNVSVMLTFCLYHLAFAIIESGIYSMLANYVIELTIGEDATHTTSKMVFVIVSLAERKITI